VYLFPLGGTVVSFSDLTANPNTATAANRSLTAELVHLLEDPEPVAVGGLQMNIWPGAGQPAKRRVIENLQRRARGLGFTLVGNPEETGGVS